MNSKDKYASSAQAPGNEVAVIHSNENDHNSDQNITSRRKGASRDTFIRKDSLREDVDGSDGCEIQSAAQQNNGEQENHVDGQSLSSQAATQGSPEKRGQDRSSPLGASDRSEGGEEYETLTLKYLRAQDSAALLECDGSEYNEDLAHGGNEMMNERFLFEEAISPLLPNDGSNAPQKGTPELHTETCRIEWSSTAQAIPLKEHEEQFGDAHPESHVHSLSKPQSQYFVLPEIPRQVCCFCT